MLSQASNPSDLWYRQHCFDLHRRRIDIIKHRPKQTYAVLSKTMSAPRLPSDRQVAICKENQILLSKIVTISTGKSQSPKGSGENLLPCSLNESMRRREKLRIAEENKALIGRIVGEKAVLSTKRLAEDFKRIQSYKDLYLSTPARVKAAADFIRRGKGGRIHSVRRAEVGS